MKKKKIKTTGQKLKIGAIAVALVVVGLSAGYVLGVVGYIKVIGPYVSEMKYKVFLKDYLKPYEEDFTGGDTPEETIDLFIEVLKKGDYELAVKYFEIQEQEKQKESYINLTEENKKNIIDWINEIERKKNIWHKDKQDENNVEFWYNVGEGENERTHSIYLRKNINNKWKIEGF
ncbi:hypothetical protein KKF23_02875 [Patescibacteria group bacterium]|nr:hypothetical protein [Patescibacteria group bacterium]